MKRGPPIRLPYSQQHQCDSPKIFHIPIRDYNNEVRDSVQSQSTGPAWLSWQAEVKLVLGVPDYKVATETLISWSWPAPRIFSRSQFAEKHLVQSTWVARSSWIISGVAAWRFCSKSVMTKVSNSGSSEATYELCSYANAWALICSWIPDLLVLQAEGCLFERHAHRGTHNSLKRCCRQDSGRHMLYSLHHGSE